MSWSVPFEDPISLPDGRELATLLDAAEYVKKLSKTEHESPHWQLAVEVLIEAAQGRGPLLHASVGVRRALNVGRPVRVRKKQVKTYRII